MKMKLTSALLALAFAAEAVDSSNAHGILRIESTATNTLMAIPWRGYTEFNTDDLALRADRLVKPRNLTVGDQLLLLDAAHSQTFAMWTLQNVGRDGVVQAWVPGVTVRSREDGSSYVYDGGADLTAERGYGLWLVRQRPLDGAGRPIPFYVHGQWTKGPQEVEVLGVSEEMRRIRGYDAAGYTMLANPDCSRGTDVNADIAWDWSVVGTNDTLIVNTDAKTSQYCFRREVKRGADKGTFSQRWYRAVIDGTSTATTTYTDDITVPPGVGFWYVRRCPGNFRLTWKCETK